MHQFELIRGIAAACRRIHKLLTGPGASRSATDSSLSGEMIVIWNDLSTSWDDLEGVKQYGVWNGAIDETCSIETVDVFISSWQIFMFECRES